MGNPQTINTHTESDILRSYYVTLILGLGIRNLDLKNVLTLLDLLTANEFMHQEQDLILYSDGIPKCRATPVMSNGQFPELYTTTYLPDEEPKPSYLIGTPEETYIGTIEKQKEDGGYVGFVFRQIIESIN